ncbi:BTAD domain-containing putative transcriptional regulator [Streptomyces sp. N2A]|uniref:AfsR/SARP family transcriptional regulator n=1 Tax=Streptomyces sp. N2A TaxID=3073936 RepID=UPI00286FE393|nr:BTAD domain-containing putative transcriptional regulator [Streptomyces sp. N2A]
MKIRVLGSVNVMLQGQPVGPSSSRTKLLLASLAWQPNEFVSDEIVIDRIWGDDLPQRPKDTLYTFANRLRKCLDVANGATVAGRVIRHRGGYTLECDPNEIDLHHFRDLATRAQEAVHRGDDSAAADLFGRAIATWGGTALCDIESAWAERARTALQRELLAARVGWARAGLELGRQAELLPQLSSLADEHPFDEAIAGLHMLALYRAGRQKEAWEVYAHVRTRLVEQLGEEPGVKLQELHQALLQREDHGIAPRRDTVPLPRQLPAPVNQLHGCREVMMRLQALLPAMTQLISPLVIHGPAGAGKTALAVRWAHDVANHFPDGQLYVQYWRCANGDRLAPGDILPGLLTSLGVMPSWVPPGTQAQTALYRSLLANRRVLVLVDGVVSHSEVTPFLPGIPGTMVVVTSQTTLPELVEQYDAPHFNLTHRNSRIPQVSVSLAEAPEYGHSRISSVTV